MILTERIGELHVNLDNDLAMFRGAFNDRVQCVSLADFPACRLSSFL